ncbi:type II toxin-antitoxin system HicB family antitoxin [Methanoregula sp.]|uniref:type II toxin-antitoxin system HicB family antitoxin n=1 Tax=Methanoregula sp. TaxID=2052170 RepID=UPI003BAFFE63
MVSYTVIIETGKRNCSAYCPDLPGVIATGRTQEETFENMKAAIKFHLEGLLEDNQEIPDPVSKAKTIRIARKNLCDTVPA